MFINLSMSKCDVSSFLYNWWTLRWIFTRIHYDRIRSSNLSKPWFSHTPTQPPNFGLSNELKTLWFEWILAKNVSFFLSIPGNSRILGIFTIKLLGLGKLLKLWEFSRIPLNLRAQTTIATLWIPDNSQISAWPFACHKLWLIPHYLPYSQFKSDNDLVKREQFNEMI